jgi:hypothetical protein
MHSDAREGRTVTLAIATKHLQHSVTGADRVDSPGFRDGGGGVVAVATGLLHNRSTKRRLD